MSLFDIFNPIQFFVYRKKKEKTKKKLYLHTFLIEPVDRFPIENVATPNPYINIKRIDKKI